MIKKKKLFWFSDTTCSLKALCLQTASLKCGLIHCIVATLYKEDSVDFETMTKLVTQTFSLVPC